LEETLLHHLFQHQLKPLVLMSLAALAKTQQPHLPECSMSIEAKAPGRCCQPELGFLLRARPAALLDHQPMGHAPCWLDFPASVLHRSMQDSCARLPQATMAR
jgi:hypothetical protein